ncbi:MAG: hypothetical protein IE881_07765 [Epsilonproteobacteria bacterium]|nr:hypothetical protein [Campylobacterota bacterium]
MFFIYFLTFTLFLNANPDIEYYSSGAVKIITQSINTKSNKVEKWFYEDGKVWIELNFINDKPHGMKKEYDESGKLIKITKYKNGVKIF